MKQGLRIAIQKSGRLSDESFKLLDSCGVSFDRRRSRLLLPSLTFPIEVMQVRDDDIPSYVRDGVCDLGIVGKNLIEEKLTENQVRKFRSLDFGYCRLSLAVPAKTFDRDNFTLTNVVANKRIATSYPATLRKFLNDRNIPAEIVDISGSVEIATSLDIADLVCDLVSSGATLKDNGLTEAYTILESQACLIGSKKDSNLDSNGALGLLLARMDGVIKAKRSRYIMMNAPSDALDGIKKILPGMENPTVVPLSEKGKIAIHAVAKGNLFWETIERLKKIGASSILVTPIDMIFE